MGSNFILIGADPSKKASHPGGQLTACSGLMQYALENGFTLHIIDILQNNFPKPFLFQRIIKGLRRVINLLAKLKTEDIKGVIIFSGAGCSFYERTLMSLICRLFRVKDVFLMRDGYFMKRHGSSRISYLVTKFLLKIPYVFGVQGEFWREVYQCFGVSRVRIVMVRNWLPKGCLINDKPKVMLKNQLIRFIFVGWLVQDKGILNLLYAIEQLLKHYDFEFVMIGGGTLETYVKNRINDLNLNGSVYVTGWLSSKEVQDELDKAHVFILPTEFEGFPNALLEAMAKGLAVISTRVGAIPDSIRDNENGYLIEPKKPEQLINAMKNYILYSSLIAKHSLKSLEIVRANHSFETNCQKIFNVFMKD